MKVAHEKHPRCPACGKALYKRPTPGPVKKSDPYAFCRNDKCVSLKARKNGHKTNVPMKGLRLKAKIIDDPLKEELKPIERVEPVVAKPKRRARPAAEMPKAPAEPPAIADVRAQIKGLLEKVVPSGTPKVSIGLMLAILNHELGSFEASNVIIREFNLKQVLGFEEFGPKGA